jgi:hypothetical protein|tara:strand:- start:226 stop:462 length:237 start_codon:yes stop_codon:yes gene_type:complete
MVDNPKPKYVNGSKYPNAKMTVSNDMNPYAGSTTNKDYEVSTASMRIEGPKKIDNLGSGPKGQRSKMQIKKVPFKGVF